MIDIGIGGGLRVGVTEVDVGLGDEDEDEDEEESEETSESESRGAATSIQSKSRTMPKPKPKSKPESADDLRQHSQPGASVPASRQANLVAGRQSQSIRSKSVGYNSDGDFDLNMSMSMSMNLDLDDMAVSGVGIGMGVGVGMATEMNASLEGADAEAEKEKENEVQAEAGIVMFPCFKGAVGGEPDSALILRGEDRAIAVRFRGTGLDACPEHIVYPQKYMRRNWPLTHVAGCLSAGRGTNPGASEDPDAGELKLAVAGRHGICVYLGEIQKWREFGTSEQERAVSCCSLAWFDDSIVIVGTPRHAESTSALVPDYSLLLYCPTREFMRNGQHLSEIQLGHQKPLALATDTYNVAVLTSGSIVVVYKLNVARSNGPVTSKRGGHTHDLPKAKAKAKAEPRPNPSPHPSHSHSMDLSSITGISCTGPVLSISMDPSLPRSIAVRLVPPHLLRDFPKASSSGGRPSIGGDGALTVDDLATAPAPAPAPAPAKRLPRLLVLRADGSLSIIAGRRGRSELICRGVDAVWLSVGSNQSQHQHCDAVWIQRKGTVKVVDGSLKLGSGGGHASPQLPTSTEVHPLGFEAGLGMIVGVTQVVTVPQATRSHVTSGRFLLLVRTQPYLHTFFVHHLSNGRSHAQGQASASASASVSAPAPTPASAPAPAPASTRESAMVRASSVASKWEIGPHRSHFMELALRGTLDAAIASGDMSMLEDAAAILRDHDRFPAAVAGCARKVDVKYWETLFGAAGSPITLFDRALAAGDLLAAVALIPVLRRSMLAVRESPSTSQISEREAERRKHRRAVAWGLRGTLLLSALLASGDMQSADDLLRFLLGPSASEIAAGAGVPDGNGNGFGAGGGGGGGPGDGDVLARSSILLTDVVPDEELRYGVDCVIGHRAELLLREGSVAELVVLSTSLRRWFSLPSWLARNWSRLSVGFDTATGLRTLQSAFALYAKQRSREDSVTASVEEGEGGRAGAGEDGPDAGQGQGQGQDSPDVVRRVAVEVEYLFDVFVRAGVWEWALCTATFLRRPDATVSLLRRIAGDRVKAEAAGRSQHSQNRAGASSGLPETPVSGGGSRARLQDAALQAVWREFVQALALVHVGGTGSYQVFSRQVEKQLGMGVAPDTFEALV